MRTSIAASAIALALGSFTLFTACGKDGDTGEPGPAGPSLTGDLGGFVNLFDQYGAHILVDNDSSLVTLDGTTSQSYTDSVGRYLFSGLQTGVYDLTCVHTGFGMNKVNGLQFTGGGDVNRDIRLSLIPSFQVDSITIAPGAGGLAVTGHLVSDAQQRTVLLFVGSASNTSADPATYLTFYNRMVGAGQTDFTLQIPTSDLTALGLSSGQSVYFACYGATMNYNNSSSYEDLNTGRTVFTAISANAAVQSALVP